MCVLLKIYVYIHHILGVGQMAPDVSISVYVVGFLPGVACPIPSLALLLLAYI